MILCGFYGLIHYALDTVVLALRFNIVLLDA